MRANEIPQALERAVGFHHSGQFPAAEQIYRQILAVDPRNVNAIQLLGALAYQSGQSEQAIDLLRQAIALDPRQPMYHSNLGNALRTIGNLEEAEASCRRAVELQPSYAEAHNNLGVVLEQRGQLPEAAKCFREAVRQKPDYAEAYYNLGLAMKRLGQLDKAVPCYARAVRYRPNYAEAHCSLAKALKDLHREREALVSYAEALRLKPSYPEALNGRGAIYLEQGRIAEAIDHFTEAVALRPKGADSHLNRGLALLQLGRFTAGWPEYEWRFQFEDMPERQLPKPRWQGESLAGRTILLHAEQGLGDTIHFVRYAVILAEQGARVIVECQRPLLPLLKTCPGIAQLVASGDELPEFDFHCPMMSVPGVVGTTVETIPASPAYLAAEPDRIDRWRQELGSDGQFRIGIAWQGNPQLSDDRRRSFRLSEFAPLAAVPGVQLFSLQKGPGEEQLCKQSWSCIDLASRIDPPGEAFLDTAAVMNVLDLVVSSDTSILHLAGALGVRAWAALTYAPDWRWLLDRPDTPWYPSVRLFRQSLQDDWTSVFAQMAAVLRSELAAR